MNVYKISVIIPCYNISQYVENCMKCLRAQTFKEFEVICVNDGSTDDTLAMLNKYKWGGGKSAVHKKSRCITSQK